MAVLYQLKPAYVSSWRGGSVNVNGAVYDVGAALTAGGGTITATDGALMSALDGVYALQRVGVDTIPPSADYVPIYALVGTDALPGDVIARRADGRYENQTPTGGGGGGTAGHVIADEGTARTQRATLNFTGAGVTVTDNAGAARTDVTIPSGGSSLTVQDEGSPLTQRTTLNFTGAGVTVTDNAGSTRTDVTIAGGGGGSLPWVNAADYGFAQGASAATIKTSLVNAIAALPAAGGTVLLPDADVTIDLSGGPVAVGTRAVRLVGGTNTRIKCSNESTTAGLTMFSLASTGGAITVESLRLEGPDVIGTAGSVDLIAVGSASASGRITAIDCDFAKFTYALRVSSSVNWIGWIEAVQCTFTGYGSSTTSMASTPVLMGSQSTGALGRGLRLKDCEFRSFGLGGSNLFHGMYVNTDWDLEVDGCHFISSIGTGYCIQIYDGAGTNTASTHQKITRCHFYAALTVKGVVIANKARALVAKCTFDNATSWVLWSDAGGGFGGGGEIVDNVFTGVNASGTAGLDQSSTTSGNQGVKVARNRFTGSAAALISCGPGYWVIEDNEFAPGTAPTTCIDASLALTRLVVKGNTFRGNATQWVWLEAGGTALIMGNFFWQTTGIAYRNSSTATVQRLVANDFSQVAGASVTNSATPTTYQAKANYGSVGLADV